MASKRPLLVSAIAVSTLAVGFGLAQPEGRRGGGAGGQGLSADRFVDRLMEGDTDGDGKLTREEVPGRFGDQIFDEADGDGDGMLSRAELTKFAQERFAGRGGAGARQGGGGIEPVMRRAGEAAKALRDSAMNADTLADDLAQVGVIQASLVAAKSMSSSVEMTAQAKEKYGEDAGAFRKDMRLELIGAIEEALRLERSLLAGEHDAAREHLDTLLDERDGAHKLFREDI